MPRRKEEWITSAEAATILSEKSGRTVPTAYVRQIALKGKIETKQIDARTKQFLKADVEAYPIRQSKKDETLQPPEQTT